MGNRWIRSSWQRLGFVADEALAGLGVLSEVHSRFLVWGCKRFVCTPLIMCLGECERLVCTLLTIGH